MVAGSYDKRIYHIDPRRPSIVAEKRYHRQPILCLAVDDNFIITGSEDKTLAVYDRRADALFKTINVSKYLKSV